MEELCPSHRAVSRTESLILKLATWREGASWAQGSAPTSETADKPLAVLLVILSDQLNTDNPKIPVGVSVHIPRWLTEAGVAGGGLWRVLFTASL